MAVLDTTLTYRTEKPILLNPLKVEWLFNFSCRSYTYECILLPNREQRHTSAYLWLCTFHWEALPVSCHQSEQNQPQSSQLHRSPSPGLDRISRLFNIEALVSTITDEWHSPLNTSETQSLKGLSVDLWGGLKASTSQENKKLKEEESGKTKKHVYSKKFSDWYIVFTFSGTVWITLLTRWTSVHQTLNNYLQQTFQEKTFGFLSGCF